MPHLSWQATVALALLALLAAPASAQGEPSASVAAQAALLKVGADETRTVTWIVANNGQPVPVGLGQGEPTATVTLQVPDGWAASIGPGDQSFPLPAGSQRTISVVVTIPQAAGTGPDRGEEGPAPADGALTLAMTLSDAAGRSSSASAPVTLSYVAPPATVIEKDYTRAIVTGTASGLVLLGVAAFLVVYLRRASQVALHVDPVQRPITSGTDGIFLVQVENRGRIRREVEVDVAGLPALWYGAFSFPKVQLAPGERTPVPLCVKIPLGAPDGVQAELVLRARPSSRFPWLVHARTRIEAHDRVRIGKAEPSTQPAP